MEEENAISGTGAFKFPFISVENSWWNAWNGTPVQFKWLIYMSPSSSPALSLPTGFSGTGDSTPAVCVNCSPCLPTLHAPVVSPSFQLLFSATVDRHYFSSQLREAAIFPEDY
jgi:hypothetical protein